MTGIVPGPPWISAGGAQFRRYVRAFTCVFHDAASTGVTGSTDGPLPGIGKVEAGIHRSVDAEGVARSRLSWKPGAS